MRLQIVKSVVVELKLLIRNIRHILMRTFVVVFVFAFALVLACTNYHTIIPRWKDANKGNEIYVYLPFRPASGFMNKNMERALDETGKCDQKFFS